jgi:hypothetical protein
MNVLVSLEFLKAGHGWTNEQIKAFQIKTGQQRVDNTQIASNIRQMGRIQRYRVMKTTQKIR